MFTTTWWVVCCHYGKDLWINVEFPVSAEVKTALKTAVEVMQLKNFVHGDLRPQNILVVGNKVRLLDFDWAGNEGTARYPKALNLRTGPWHSDVSPGGIITKEHDLLQIHLL